MSDEQPQEIPPHHSPVRSMWAEGHDLPYEPFHSLDEARSHPEAVMILEADSGGQILATCPVRYVIASEPALNQLLCDLENITWGAGGLAEDDQPYDAQIYYEVLPVGSGVGGGMGGGLVVDGVWVHRELEQESLREQIEAVILGRCSRLALNSGPA